MVISSTAAGSAARPAITRARSTTPAKFASVAAAIDERNGARGTLTPNACKTANAETPGTRANA